MKRIRSILISTVISLAGLAAVPASAEELVLRAAAFSPLETTWGVPVRMFVDHVNETGKGVLQINLTGPEAIPPAEQPNALRAGVIDMLATPPGTYKQIVPEANAQDLSDMTIAEQRASGGYEMVRDITRKRLGAEILTTFGQGVPFHIFLTKNVSSPDDLRGLRLRSQPIFNPFLSSLGATGSIVSVGETYTALERGVVQGYAFPAWGVQDLGWDRLTKVRIEPGFYNVVVNILLRQDRYEKLASDQRKVLDDAVAWFEQMMPGWIESQAPMHRKAQDLAGIVAVDFGPDFARKAADTYWAEMERDSPDNIPALRKLLQK